MSTSPPPATGARRVSGLLFGIAFGFLLQKGGVAHYDVLIGSLLLQDFTVFKVMLSAILVGMIGIFAMHHRGMVKLHPKPFKLASNVIGGLLFGVGFGLCGYCPGTGAAALGQGSYDAIFAVLGILGGSYVYAHFSHVVDRTIGKWGDRGHLLATDLVRAPVGVVVGAAAMLLIAAMIVLHQW